MAWNPSASPGVVGYRVYQGTSSAGYTTSTDAGALTNVTVAGLTAGVTYYFAVTAYEANGSESGDSGEISFAVPATNSPAPTPSPSLPLPWAATDIGAVGLNGNSAVTNTVYEVTGAGALSGSADAFQFLYQPMTGDGQITAQIGSLDNTGTGARAGLMIRETLTPGSAYVFWGISPDGTVRWQRRRATAAATFTSTFGMATNPWVRLVRSGNNVTAYESADGNSWTAFVTKNNVSMATNILMGLAVTSGSTNSLATGTFTNVLAVP